MSWCCYCQVTSVVSDSVRLHGRQPTGLPSPGDSLGKSTGVGCHFLLQCMKVKSHSEVAQLRPTLSDPMDCSLPGSSIHGIFQARVGCHHLYFILWWWLLPYIDMNQPRMYTCPPSRTRPITLGCPSAPASSALFHASNLDWSSTSHMVIYMFQCYCLKSSHPCLLPESKSPFFISVSLLLAGRFLTTDHQGSPQFAFLICWQKTRL